MTRVVGASRRARRLDVRLDRQSRCEPTHLILDSTGLSIVGAGQRAAAKPGARGMRGWKKLQLGVDADGVVVAQALTDGNADDAKAGVSMIENVPGSSSA